MDDERVSAKGKQKNFFLKKEAKTFARWRERSGSAGAKVAKVFWFFFSEKNRFLGHFQ
jgi:hypothetical protein